MKMFRMTLICLFALGAFCARAADCKTEPLSGSVESIDGKTIDLATYKGKVVMVVNVASRCGYTKQYKQLREIYEKYESRGFVILGFPCNQFAGQEPGTNEEILFFCETKFSVNFPMFAKIDVKGEKAIPLFKYLTSDNPPFKDQGPVKWNFEKFLFNRKGEVVARYRSRTTPDDPQVIAAIEAALAEEAPTGEKKILESQDNKKMEKRSEENPTTEQKNAQTGEINE